MFVLDVLFDHIQQISSNIEIIGSLVQFAQFRQLMSELGHSRPKWAVRTMSGLPPASDRIADIAGGPFRSSNGLMYRSKQRRRGDGRRR
jgi:hypothetical protein